MAGDLIINGSALLTITALLASVVGALSLVFRLYVARSDKAYGDMQALYEKQLAEQRDDCAAQIAASEARALRFEQMALSGTDLAARAISVARRHGGEQEP